MTRHRIGIAVLLVLLLAVAGVAAFAAGLFKGTPLTPAEIAAEKAARAAALLQKAEANDIRATKQLVAVPLPAGNNATAPGATTNLFSRPLAPVEVLGFVPYWEASAISAAELADVSSIALFGVEVTASGSFLQSGPGWSDYQATGYRALTAAAHQDGDRVLFTVSTTAAAVIHHLVDDPRATSTALAQALAGAVASGGLDGVDIDIEGSLQSERAGFVNFVRDLVSSLRADGMRGQIVLDCYPQAAGDSTSFYDVARLAPYVDRVFVMAYDMEQYSTSSPTAPLQSPDLGLSDVQSLIQYTKDVPAKKLLLGVPFYGIDFTTETDKAGSLTVTPYPTEETNQTILAAGRTPFWDSTTDTVWTHFKHGGSWHQTWYDDPVSIALKRALAARFHLAGVGAWALGFEGANTSLLGALDGEVAPKRVSLSGG